MAILRPQFSRFTINHGHRSEFASFSRRSPLWRLLGSLPTAECRALKWPRSGSASSSMRLASSFSSARPARVVLTESGEQFQIRARSLIADLDDTLAGLKRAGDRLEGRILIMVPTTLNILVLSDALNESSARTRTHHHGIGAGRPVSESCRRRFRSRHQWSLPPAATKE